MSKIVKKLEVDGVEVKIECIYDKKIISINGENIVVNVNGDEILNNSSKPNINKIYKFVNKYKYPGDKVESGIGTHKSISVSIQGYEFFAHWVEPSNNDTNEFKLNEYIPDYKTIYEHLLETHVDNYEILSLEEYEAKFNSFVKELKDIGVGIHLNLVSEFDVLATFILSAEQLDDKSYIDNFIKLVEEYKNQFINELDSI